MECIEWLFFDVGSTLMNEEKAYLHRLHDIADSANETFEKIYDMAIALCHHLNEQEICGKIESH